MNPSPSQPHWWDLHLRKARGETLSESEEQFYEAEMARQDREASPLQFDLKALKQLRDQTLVLVRENALMRARASEVEQEIRSSKH